MFSIQVKKILLHEYGLVRKFCALLLVAMLLNVTLCRLSSAQDSSIEVPASTPNTKVEALPANANSLISQDQSSKKLVIDPVVDEVAHKEKEYDTSSDFSYSQYLIKVTSFLLIVMMIGAGLVSIAKKYNFVTPGSRSRIVEIKETIPLTSKTTLCVVSIRGEELVCAVGNESVTILAGSYQPSTVENDDSKQQLPSLDKSVNS